MKEISGFLTKDEMFDSASKIGDVTTPEGKEQMLEFLAKGFKTMEVSDSAREAFVDAFFIKYMTRCPLDGSYYFENGKLKPGRDLDDGIIGNAIEHFDTAVDYGDRIMSYYEKTRECTIRDYSDVELSALNESFGKAK